MRSNKFDFKKALDHDYGSLHHWGGENLDDNTITFSNFGGNPNAEMEMFDNDASTIWQSSLGGFLNRYDHLNFSLAETVTKQFVNS